MRKSRSVQWLLAAVICVVAATADASFHLWRVNEIYSNADGTVQFIEFREIAGANGENFVAGHTIVVQNGNQTHTFTFPDNLPSTNTANRFFIVGTPGFASLGTVAPDFVIPPGFLFVQGGVLMYGGQASSGIYGMPTAPVDTVSYGPLPTDGVMSIDRSGAPHTNSPTNFAGVTGTIGAGPPPAAVVPQTGWWWNAAESGRGYFIERQGNDIFFAAYLYAPDGTAMWTVSAGSMSSDSTFQGSLLTFSTGQTLVGPYRAPTAGAPLGTLTLQFSDATHGTLTWPGGTIPIQRFDYAGLGSPTVANAPQNGWWWNASESGRGFSLEVQGSTLFIAGYMYDVSGNPVWYLSVGTLNATGMYQGTWSLFANGQSMNGVYRAPTLVSSNVGGIVLQFTDAQHATLTLPDGRMIALTRLPF